MFMLNHLMKHADEGELITLAAGDYVLSNAPLRLSSLSARLTRVEQERKAQQQAGEVEGEPATDPALVRAFVDVMRQGNITGHGPQARAAFEEPRPTSDKRRLMRCFRVIGGWRRMTGAGTGCGVGGGRDGRG